MTNSPLNTLAARLESLPALDGAARAAAGIVRSWMPEGPGKDLLSGKWLGHAVHPVVSDIPIGVWTSAAILDWTAGRDGRAAADRLDPHRAAGRRADGHHRLVGLDRRRGR